MDPHISINKKSEFYKNCVHKWRYKLAAFDYKLEETKLRECIDQYDNYAVFDSQDSEICLDSQNISNQDSQDNLIIRDSLIEDQYIVQNIHHCQGFGESNSEIVQYPNEQSPNVSTIENQNNSRYFTRKKARETRKK